MRRGRSAGFALLAVLLAPVTAFADDCTSVMRAIKLDVFDQKWESVETGARQLLATYPDCTHREQAAYLRAQSLDRGGHPEQALAAYSGFLSDYCGEPDATVHCSLAQVAIYDLAGRMLDGPRRRDALSILLEGLDQPGDAGVFAALTLADQSDTSMRKEALPHLKAALETDLDRDIRNRVCLAILRIEPGPSPCAESSSGRTPGSPTLISVEVLNAVTGQPELRLNMPVALAEAVVRALPAEIRNEMSAEGVDVQSIFQAIRDNATGTIFQLETEDTKVRIWLQ